MSRKQYFVSYEDGEWKIIFEDEHIEGYPSEAAAFRALSSSRASPTSAQPTISQLLFFQKNLCA